MRFNMRRPIAAEPTQRLYGTPIQLTRIIRRQLANLRHTAFGRNALYCTMVAG
jgi:hypothetical protein